MIQSLCPFLLNIVHLYFGIPKPVVPALPFLLELQIWPVRQTACKVVIPQPLLLEYGQVLFFRSHIQGPCDLTTSFKIMTNPKKIFPRCPFLGPDVFGIFRELIRPWTTIFKELFPIGETMTSSNLPCLPEWIYFRFVDRFVAGHGKQILRR